MKTENESTSDTLAYQVGATTFRAARRSPQTAPARRMAVLIAPDWRGLSTHALEQADKLAATGHDVVVADLYGGGLCAKEESEAKPLIQGLVGNRAELTKRMQACVEAFAAVLPASTPIVALGYSIGGMALLDLGRSGSSLSGIVLASALLKTAEEGTSTKVAAPVLVLQGTRDVVSPMDVLSALVEEMDAAGNRFRMVLYGQTGHAFYNPEAGTDPNARLVYSPEVDRLSQREIERFFESTFGPQT